MKRFRFTLAALHVVRQRQEQEATELYAKALLERQKARDHLEALTREQDAQAEETRREMSAGCPADRLRLRQVFHETLRQAIRAQEQAVAAADMRVQQVMQALVRAKQQREAVDKVHEHQLAAHDRNASREEAALLDELARRQLGNDFRGQHA